jgi:hypothetical protein
MSAIAIHSNQESFAADDLAACRGMYASDAVVIARLTAEVDQDQLSARNPEHAKTAVVVRARILSPASFPDRTRRALGVGSEEPAAPTEMVAACAQ